MHPDEEKALDAWIMGSLVFDARLDCWRVHTLWRSGLRTCIFWRSISKVKWWQWFRRLCVCSPTLPTKRC